MKPILDIPIHQFLEMKLEALEKHFQADILTYFGPSEGDIESTFLKIIEKLINDPNKKDEIIIVLATGGSMPVLERFADILQGHYTEITIIFPDYIYSAGTIFGTRGNNILMDYFSVLDSPN